MNSRQKGMRNERRAEKILQSEGWLTYRVKAPTKFSKCNDIFGLFDILAIQNFHELYPKKRTFTAIRFVQVKSNRKPPLKPFKEFSEQYPNFQCEVWVFKDRQKQPERIGI